MALPVTVAAKGCHHLPLLRTGRQLLLPMVNLLGSIEPARHDRALQRLQLPALLLGHLIGPDQKFIQHKGTKPGHNQTGELLQLETPQRVTQPEEVQKNQSQPNLFKKAKEIGQENCSK